jgi:hypothetical protein
MEHVHTPQAIAGFFKTRAEGEAAEEALLASGFTRDEVSFVAGDTSGHQIPALGPVETTGAESQAAGDAFIGGVVGLAAGMVAVVLPGIGPLIAAGPLAGTIAGAIGGLGVGAATGGIIGLLRDHGISEDEARFFAEGVKRGGSLVTVRTSEDRVDQARKTLERNGAIDTESLAEGR